MKIFQAAFLSTATLIGSANAMDLRSLFNYGAKAAAADQSAAPAEADAERDAIVAELTATNDAPNDEDRSLQSANDEDRSLQSVNSPGCTTRQQWHPNYNAGWSSGFCSLRADCNSPGYGTQLACCRAAYAGQTSGNCLMGLPSPPTTSPTGAGGLGVWYPDYSIGSFAEGFCRNERPLPNGWPTYSSELACCRGAYGGQMSGRCLSQLPSPPTTSPTNSAFETDFFYPVYEVAWSESGCSNALPLPFRNKADRPNYATHLACCRGAYGGQTSGICLSQLDSPPTTSPTATGGSGKWTADRTMSYEIATCTNVRANPYIPGAAIEYDSQLLCCRGAYGNQASGACLSELPSPPTESPTDSAGNGGSRQFFPVRTAARICSVDGNRNEAASTSQLACCSRHYAGETTCMCDADPCSNCQCTGPGSWTTSPTACPTLTCSPPTSNPTRRPV